MGAVLLASRVTARAVILARGLGTRMRSTTPAGDNRDGRAATAAPALAAGQDAAARSGAKGMIPFGEGRPFLDWVLSGLADAGIREVCLVVAPGPGPLRDYYEGPGRPTRVALTIVDQQEPRGTADAVLAAEGFSEGQSFLAVNADNLYPMAALTALRMLPRAGLVGFRLGTLTAGGNIPAERISAFALIDVAADGTLARIVEKPDERAARTFGGDPLVSMNAWLLPSTIFASCRAITLSSRGELELQDAVCHSMTECGERYFVTEIDASVLDLSERSDIPAVAARLHGLDPRP